MQSETCLRVHDANQLGPSVGQRRQKYVEKIYFIFYYCFFAFNFFRNGKSKIIDVRNRGLIKIIIVWDNDLRTRYIIGEMS